MLESKEYIYIIPMKKSNPLYTVRSEKTIKLKKVSLDSVSKLNN